MATPRPQRRTTFGFGEGEAEIVFIKHLQELYAPPRLATFRVRPAGGKNPDYILTKAIRVRGNVPYDHSFILLDTDVEWSDVLQAKARNEDFELIGNTPCIEGLFLSILNPGVEHAGRSSSACKREFEKTHLAAARIINDKDCQKLFAKAVLDKTRTRIANLHRLIQIMEGNFNP